MYSRMDEEVYLAVVRKGQRPLTRVNYLHASYLDRLYIEATLVEDEKFKGQSRESISTIRFVSKFLLTCVKMVL